MLEPAIVEHLASLKDRVPRGVAPLTKLATAAFLQYLPFYGAEELESLHPDILYGIEAVLFETQVPVLAFSTLEFLEKLRSGQVSPLPYPAEVEPEPPAKAAPRAKRSTGPRKSKRKAQGRSKGKSKGKEKVKDSENPNAQDS